MDITGLSGFRTAYSSALVRGITDTTASAATMTGITILALDIAADSLTVASAVIGTGITEG